MTVWLHKAGRSGFSLLRKALDATFGAAGDPLRHLGSLTIFFLWIALISGIWLTMFFRTSVHGAYESVEYLTHQQWYFGGVMRSLHRYASDAAVMTLVLHVLKEFSFDRYRGARWFSWVTGIPLVWLIALLGITGYWLVWDQLAHYVALTSAELLDWIPIFTDSMARNFLSEESLSDRFFTLMTFIHLVGLPLVLVLAIWLHVFRINGPAINPPRKLMAGALLCMLMVSVLFPALSREPADLARVPESLSLDWYYLLVYPLVQSWSPGAVWALLFGFSLLLCLGPWLPPSRPPRPATVDLDNCNGCERCADDCPFGAITMAPRSDGARYEREAVVNPDLCTRCGICVGACPTATPFRRQSDLSPGIDMPDLSAADLRQTLVSACEALTGTERLVVFGCADDRRLKGLCNAATAVIKLTCQAQLPPPFIDFILSRNLADGVVMAGCAGGDCHYRLGANWAEQRIGRQRDPQLRKRVDVERIALLWKDYEGQSVDQAISSFRQRLGGASDSPAEPRPWLRYAGIGVAYAAFGLLAWWFSAWPSIRQLQPGQAVVSLSISHAGQRIKECRILTQDELNELPPNMRKPSDCPRERWPVSVSLSSDGIVLYDEQLDPSGIWNDGESTIYQRIVVPAGPRRLKIQMTDAGPGAPPAFQQSLEVDLAPSQHLLVEFDNDEKAFLFR